MDIEELKKALKTNEGKELLATFVEAEVKSLKEKNAELIENSKKQKEANKTLESRLEALEKAKEDAEADAINKSGDIEKIKQQLIDKHTKELAKANEEKSALANQLNVHVVDGSLTQALIKAGVAPQFMEAATALIKTANKAEIATIDGKPIAKLGGFTAEEFVMNWAKSDTGKHFVSAANNSGGGSQGADGSGKAATGTTMKRTEFEALSPVAKMETSKKGVQLID